MAQIKLEIPDELLQQLTKNGEDPIGFFQTRLLELSSQPLEGIFVEPSLDQKFQLLARQWQQETRHLSLVSDIVINAAYQQIIGMGTPAIPLLLQELKRQPDHWFWALRSITGENPISPADRGRLSKMADAWLEWGREHGYQC